MKKCKIQTNYLALAIALPLMLLTVSAQDLMRKVPEGSQMLITINNKAVFDHLEINQVDRLFEKLGFFNGEDVQVSGLEDLGIDYSAKAYVYGQMTDSVNYFGALIPLVDSAFFWMSFFEIARSVDR